MFFRIIAAVLLVSTAVCAQQNRKRTGAAPTPAVLSQSAFTTTSGLTASPGTITFTSSDPDAGPVSGSTATVTWIVTNGSKNNNWTLSVSVGSPTLTNCGTVPASAIRVTCARASVGGGGSGSCRPAFDLSTTPQTVASGQEGNNTRTYTVTINYSFTDQWKYIAAVSPACAATLTYTADNP